MDENLEKLFVIRKNWFDDEKQKDWSDPVIASYWSDYFFDAKHHEVGDYEYVKEFMVVMQKLDISSEDVLKHLFVSLKVEILEKLFYKFNDIWMSSHYFDMIEDVIWDQVETEEFKREREKLRHEVSIHEVNAKISISKHLQS